MLTPPSHKTSILHSLLWRHDSGDPPATSPPNGTTHPGIQVNSFDETEMFSRILIFPEYNYEVTVKGDTLPSIFGIIFKNVVSILSGNSEHFRKQCGTKLQSTLSETNHTRHKMIYAYAFH